MDEDNRRKGIGKKLPEYFITKAEKDNCKAVKSRVNLSNLIAQKFHTSLGFAEADTYEYFKDLKKQKRVSVKEE